jgi:hypothetical protein
MLRPYVDLVIRGPDLPKHRRGCKAPKSTASKMEGVQDEDNVLSLMGVSTLGSQEEVCTRLGKAMLAMCSSELEDMSDCRRVLRMAAAKAKLTSRQCRSLPGFTRRALRSSLRAKRVHHQGRPKGSCAIDKAIVKKFLLEHSRESSHTKVDGTPLFVLRTSFRRLYLEEKSIRSMISYRHLIRVSRRGKMDVIQPTCFTDKCDSCWQWDTNYRMELLRFLRQVKDGAAGLMPSYWGDIDLKVEDYTHSTKLEQLVVHIRKHPKEFKKERRLLTEAALRKLEVLEADAVENIVGEGKHLQSCEAFQLHFMIRDWQTKEYKLALEASSKRPTNTLLLHFDFQEPLG